MTIELRRSTLVSEGNTRLRNRMNSGVSWGTNNHPEFSNINWFAGPTGGNGHSLVNASFGPNTSTLASNVIAGMRNFANLYAGVRNTRIVIYMSHWEVGTTVVSDQVAVANTNYSVGAYANGFNPSFSQGAEMNLSVYQQSCDNLWNYYLSVARNNTVTLTNTICHTSCHTSCHSSRGRR